MRVDRLCVSIQIGLWNVVSVPDGAPAVSAADDDSAAPKSGDADRKFSYLQTCQNLLQSIDFANEARRPHHFRQYHVAVPAHLLRDQQRAIGFDRSSDMTMSAQQCDAHIDGAPVNTCLLCVLQIFLAVDRDAAGENLAKELSRRLGRQKCKLTEWPADWLGHWTYLGVEEAGKLHKEHQAVCALSVMRAGSHERTVLACFTAVLRLNICTLVSNCIALRRRSPSSTAAQSQITWLTARRQTRPRCRA